MSNDLKYRIVNVLAVRRVKDQKKLSYKSDKTADRLISSTNIVKSCNK